MGEDLLKKLKGFSRTFVVHSNTNPYAAVAVAGMMAARSQEAGRYFRLSDTFVPMLETLAPEEHNSVPDANQIELDFKSDWIGYLRTTGLPACGLKYKDKLSPEDNTIRFLNAYNRRIPSAKPRTVHESRELAIPPQFQQDYEALVALIKAGSDLKPYLSRHIVKRKRADWNDGLLNSWGIQHLHFRIEGTDHLLFCVITDVRCLPYSGLAACRRAMGQHPAHSNPARQLAGDDCTRKPQPHEARGFFCIETPIAPQLQRELPCDGRGRNGLPSARRRNDRIRRLHRRPLQLQEDLRRTQVLAGHRRSECPCHSFVAQHADTKKLTIHMAFDNRVCCFYEPTQAARLGGFAGLIID